VRGSNISQPEPQQVAPTKLDVKFLCSAPIHFLALGFGTGLAPKAPGTFGTLAGLPFVLLIPYMTELHYAALIAIFALWGVHICGKTARNAGVHDHGAIVWDEIVGFMLTMWLSPISWLTVSVGFLLFRLFDILKPWPISYVDKHCHGGLGIMLDDILAGLAAFAVMQLLF
jgi:phosphatidylglycerophosphatase A